MIAIKRGNQVNIEDGNTRLVVRQDGSGWMHEPNHEAYEVEMHEPVYLRAAKDAGLNISEATISISRIRFEGYFAQ